MTGSPFVCLLLVLCGAIVHNTAASGTLEVRERNPEGVDVSVNDVSGPQVLAGAIGAHVELGPSLPVMKHQVVYLPESPELSRAFRTLVEGRCLPDRSSRCTVSPDGLATVGLFNSSFDRKLPNLRGRSSQSLITCRCLSQGCNYSLAAVPVLALDNIARRHTCLYLRRRDRDRRVAHCLTALLNLTRIPFAKESKAKFPLLAGLVPSNFSVHDRNLFWVANGTRAIFRKITQTSYASLPSVRLRDINTTRPATGDDLVGPAAGGDPFELVRADTTEDDPSRKTAVYAVRSAGRWGGHAHRSTGLLIEERPEVIPSTEILFTVAASLVALGTAIPILHKRQTEGRRSSLRSLYALGVALTVYVLEGLAIYVSYALARKAANWEGSMAHLDAVLAPHRPSNGTQWDATDSIVVLIATVGSVHYRSTNYRLLLGLVVFCTVIMGLSILWYIYERCALPVARSEDRRHEDRRALFDFLDRVDLR